MKIYIDEVPDNKSFDDYPEDTKFVHRENFPKYDRNALLNESRVVIIEPGEKGYENGISKEEIKSLLSN